MGNSGFGWSLLHRLGPQMIAILFGILTGLWVIRATQDAGFAFVTGLLIASVTWAFEAAIIARLVIDHG